MNSDAILGYLTELKVENHTTHIPLMTNAAMNTKIC